MKWLFISPLLALALVVICVPAWAQRAPAGSAGSRPAGTGQLFGSGRGNRMPFGGGCGHSGWCSGHRRDGYYGAGLFPYYGYWDGDPYWDLAEPAQTMPPPASPAPVVVVLQSADQPTHSSPVELPKLIEVPQEKNAQDKGRPGSNPASPAVFILSNGDRLQSSHYLLTVDSLRVQQGRTQRTIPLSAVNLEATMAANHERGIDLEVPENRAQITLGF